MDEKQSLGNLNEQTWEDIWNTEKAGEIRELAKKCKKNCWMIGSVAPAIWHHPIGPAMWVLGNKMRSILGKNIELRLAR